MCIRDRPTIPLLPQIYKIITCNNLIIDDKYPSILAKAKKINKIYTMILYELVDGDLFSFLMKNTLNENIWKNIYEQIMMSIFFYHSVFKEFHGDTHTKNFLYRKIAPGGCFCYNINGINYYIENLGISWIIWDYGNSQPLEKLSNPTWIDDYIRFNLGPRKRDKEIEKSIFFKYYTVHDDKFGYLPDDYNIPKSILKLQEQIAEHIYYKSYKKPQSNSKYFMPNNPGSMTEYEWFVKLSENGILFIMIIEIIFLMNIGMTSYLYTSYLIPLAAFIMPIEQHYMIMCFICILLIIDNVSLFNDLQNKNNTNTNLQIVGDQVFELTDNKVIVYNITKIKNEPITPTSKLKLKRNILNKKHPSYEELFTID
jgi:hypothetical protein